MSVRTGVDIAIIAQDLATPELDVIRAGFDDLGESAEKVETRTRDLGATISLLQGGAGVAAITLFANQLAAGAEHMRDLAVSGELANQSGLELAQTFIEMVPIVGRIAESGRRIVDAVDEAVIGEERELRILHQRDVLYDKALDTLQKQAALAAAVHQVEEDRIIAVSRELDIMDALLAANEDDEQAIKARLVAEQAIEDAMRRQSVELQRFELEREAALEALIQNGEASRQQIEDFQRETEALRRELQEQGRRELELLEERLRLEQQLLERQRQRRLEQEQARQREKEAAEEQRRLEQEQREREREEEQAARERERIAKAIRDAESRTPAALESRSLSGRAQAFVASRGQDAAQLAATRQQTGLLRELRDWLRRISEKQSVTVDFP